MDWKSLFLSPDGRIARPDYWLGVLILFVGGTALGFIPLIGPLISLALLYPWVCVYGKRLHDFGRSAFLILIPFAVAIAILLITLIGAMTVLPAFMSQDEFDPGFFAAVLSGGLLLNLASMLVSLAFTLWVGVMPGDAGPNRFGDRYRKHIAAPA